MRRFLGAGLLACAVASASAATPVHHHLRIELDPASGRLAVTDEIALQPAGGEPAPSAVEFLLNADLAIVDSSEPLERLEAGDPRSILGDAADLEPPAPVKLARYRFNPTERPLTVRYEGVIAYGLSDPKEEYTRGFRETAGTLSEEGVYLTGQTFWYPTFGDRSAGFELEVRHPEGWRVISQGRGPGEQPEVSRWSFPETVIEGIYLVGGPLISYRQAAGKVEAQVYLREPDEALSKQYLDTTGQYLAMYERLLGPYPYAKFALVENFWETGYGMPSFTLLGPRVIRFPFILHSSYPHEILHNWWGNSVFVDYSSGNWCEGLTAYLADHLVKEQRGIGHEHRREALQRYRDYVREGRDFPLAEFTSRHSAASEAVGYGKTMMGFHMLRRRLGDDTFTRALAGFYRQQRGRRASFRDLEASLEEVSGEDLGGFFDRWITQTGAPALAVEVSGVAESDGGWTVSGTLHQQQDGEAWAMAVPVAIQTGAGLAIEAVEMEGARAEFAIQVADRPLRLQVDPWFDLFRLLDPRETPPSIGQIFGDPAIVAVVPAAASPELRQRYRELAAGWRSDSHEIEIVTDAELRELPADRGVWLLGRDNRFAGSYFAELPAGDWRWGVEQVSMGGEPVALAGHSLVAVRRHPERADKAVGWLAVDPETAFPGVARKLPHYGKYSYLAFEGEEPTNTVKGQWPNDDSPLAVDLRPDAERSALGAFPVEPRSALAELPPLHSRQELEAHVAFLAAPEREGRGVGSAGLEAAADYLAQKFAADGLEPGGEGGSWFQEVAIPEGPDEAPMVGRNVIGVLRGTRSEWADQSVILSAHYDHLGRGWPDVHQGDEGAIHPGADDNASGVAVLLELARTLAAGSAPRRSLVFAAFTAEEAGRLGSRWFVEHPTPLPLSGIRSVVNLDTVGRLGDGEISVLGTGTAEEWQHIFRGSGFVTGVASRNVPASAEASDQLSFIDQGIPAVQIFTGAHADYHRPSDTADRVDPEGLVKVTSFVKEAVVYLTEREEPLTVTLDKRPEGADAEAPAAPAGGRRVRFGTIPDFAFPGPGARVDSVAPDSPAARAGLAAGDVLVRIGDREVPDLRGYSAILRTLEPGQTVTVTVLRDGEEIELPITVEAR